MRPVRPRERGRGKGEGPDSPIKRRLLDLWGALPKGFVGLRVGSNRTKLIRTPPFKSNRDSLTEGRCANDAVSGSATRGWNVQP